MCGYVQKIGDDLRATMDSYNAFVTKNDPMIRYAYMVCKKPEIMNLGGIEERGNPWALRVAAAPTIPNRNTNGSRPTSSWAPTP